MRRIPANAGKILLGDIGFRLLGFVASVHLAGALGGAAFGLVTVGLSFLSYAQSFADMGISVLGTREIARPADTREFAPADILLAKILLAAIIYPVGLAILYLVYDDPATRSLVHLFLLSLLPYAILVEWLHQGARNYTMLALGKLLSGIVWAVGILLLVDSEQQVDLVPILFFASTLVAALVLLLPGARSERLLPGRPDWSVLARLVRRGGTIGAASLLGLTVLVLPPIVVERLGSPLDAGVLGAVLKIATIFLAADRLFVALFLPAISSAWKSSREQMAGRLTTIFKGVLILGCSIGVTISLFARPILELVYGDSVYSREGEIVLSIVGWFVAATLVNSFTAYTLVAIGAERAYFRANVQSGLFVIGGIVIGTLYWGLVGTAVAIVMGEIIITAFLYSHFRRHIDMAFARPLVLALLVAALVVAGGLFAGAGSLWQIPIYLLCFVAPAALLLGVSREEIIWMKAR